MRSAAKKISVSLFVILGFFGYVWRQRQPHDDQSNPPTNSTSNESVTNTAVETNTVVTTNTSNTNVTVVTSGKYADGTYTGNVADAFYGDLQVAAVIRGGRLTDITFLQYPSDRPTSKLINTQAIPILKQEAIAAQSSDIDGASGASESSQAFRQSLQSALDQAS